MRRAYFHVGPYNSEYFVEFANMVQFRKDDTNLQRKVKREEVNFFVFFGLRVPKILCFHINNTFRNW
jgi:hypothetical protein